MSDVNTCDDPFKNSKMDVFVVDALRDFTIRIRECF